MNAKKKALVIVSTVGCGSVDVHHSFIPCTASAAVCSCQCCSVAQPVLQCGTASAAVWHSQCCSVAQPVLQCGTASAAVCSCQCCSVQLPVLQCAAASAAVWHSQCCSVQLPVLQCGTASAAVWHSQCCSVQLPAHLVPVHSLQPRVLHLLIVLQVVVAVSIKVPAAATVH